jgi:ParB family chromosome partitioning protein
MSPLSKGIIEEVEINKISLPRFSFRNIDSVAVYELSNSIKEHGLLNPIVIRTTNEGFEIVAGLLRYQACKKLGRRKIMCNIVDIDEKESFEMNLVENIHRRNLSPLEESLAFRTYVMDFGWGGITELSLRIAKSPSYVYKKLSILDLPKQVLDNYQNSLLSGSALEELVFVKSHERQIEIANRAIVNHLTIKEIRDEIKRDPNSVYDYDDETVKMSITKDEKTVAIMALQQSFDKTITTLKIASSKIAVIIEGIEDNWMVYEILMQHKNILHSQIDILIKEKKKLNCLKPS